MANRLPAVLGRYFEAQNRGDVEAMVGSFAPDALVRDEHREHRGTAAVRAWIVDVTAKYAPQVDVIETFTDGSKVDVDVSVSGTFPGGPLRLRYAFVLAERGIARLEIS